MSLCYRCEHRAKNKETNTHRPRYECGTDMSVSSCYMYRPVLPIILAPNKDDKRPIGAGWLISARMHQVKNTDELFEEVMKEVDDGVLIYWRLK